MKKFLLNAAAVLAFTANAYVLVESAVQLGTVIDQLIAGNFESFLWSIVFLAVYAALGLVLPILAFKIVYHLSFLKMKEIKEKKFVSDLSALEKDVDLSDYSQNIDMLSMSAHKFHGPKGIGALYCRKGIRLPNLIEGGAQESGRRAGTESVYAMVGMAAALKEARDHMAENATHMTKLRDRLIDGLLKIDSSRLNGDREHRLPGNVNVSFEGVEGESLLLYLDMKGVSASSGSACTSGSLDPSHVLLAIGLPHEVAHGSLRLSLCESNTEEEIDYIISCVPEIIDRLRSMSPLWERIQKERGNA